MKRFSNKVVIITGADSDIGRATALKFAKEEANCVIVGINPDILDYIYAKLPQDHTWINTGNHLSVTCDVNDSVQIEGLIKHVLEKYSHIDIMVNIDTEIDIHPAVIPELIKTKGNIVNVNTLRDIANDWTIESYNTEKDSFGSITKALALENASNGIRINAIAAGLVTIDTSPNPFTNYSPLGRTATPEDIAAAVIFLTSDDASMITGINLSIDGGVSTSKNHAQF